MNVFLFIIAKIYHRKKASTQVAETLGHCRQQQGPRSIFWIGGASSRYARTRLTPKAPLVGGHNVSEKLWNLELLKSMERRLLFLILYHHSVSFLHKNVHLKHNYSMIWRSFQVAKFITFCKDNHGHLRCHWTVILFKRTTFTVNYDVSPGLKPFTVFVFLTLLFFPFSFLVLFWQPWSLAEAISLSSEDGTLSSCWEAGDHFSMILNKNSSIYNHTFTTSKQLIFWPRNQTRVLLLPIQIIYTLYHLF